MTKYDPVVYRTLDDAIAASHGAAMTYDDEGYLIVDRFGPDDDRREGASAPFVTDTLMWPQENAYQRHIDSLCAEHHVRLIVDPNSPWGGAASKSNRAITIPEPVTNDVTYGTALHELGHLLAPQIPYNEEDEITMMMQQMFGGQTPTPNRKRNEVLAWKWAKQHAFEWTPAMQADMARALKTYSIDVSEVQ